MKRTVKTLSVVALSMMLAAPAFAANTPEGNIELEWGYRPKQGASQQLIAIANHPMPKEAMGKGFPALVEALTGKPIEQVVPESHYVQVGAVEVATPAVQPPVAPVASELAFGATGQYSWYNEDGTTPANTDQSLRFGAAYTIPSGATVNAISGTLTYSANAVGSNVTSVGDTITGNIPGIGSVTLTSNGDGTYRTASDWSATLSGDTTIEAGTSFTLTDVAAGGGNGLVDFNFNGVIQYTK